MTPDELDDLFRAGADRGEYAPRPGEWEAMSALLDADDNPYARRVGAFWLTLFALLIAVGAYGTYQYAPARSAGPETLAALPIPAHGSLPYDLATRPPSSPSPRKPTGELAAVPAGPSTLPVRAGAAGHAARGRSAALLLTGGPVLGRVPREAESAGRYTPPVESTPAPQQSSALDAVPYLSLDAIERPLSAAVESPATTVAAVRRPGARRLTVGLSVREDLSTVGLSREVRSGTRFGVDAFLTLGPKVRLRTGLAYAKRTYLADWEHWTDRDGMFAQENVPMQTEGSCKLLQVPLAVDYHPSGLAASGWFVSGGLSMRYVLHEELAFTYKPGVEGHIDEMTPHALRRFDLGAGEVSAGFRYVGGRGLAWRLGPTLEVPLSGLGYGDVSVYTLGMRLGVELR